LTGRHQQAVILSCAYPRSATRKEGPVLTTAQGGYRPVPDGVKPVLGSPPSPVVVTVAWAVLGLWVAPRATSAALARAFAAAPAGSGRSCLRRGRRGWGGPGLAQPTRRPALLRLALPLLAVAQPVVGALAPPGSGF
jgi:hypothetical protein